MNEPNRNEPTSFVAADPELEQLLHDAYDVPPMPRSLLKRIDTLVEAEWGESPRLVPNRAARIARAMSQKTRWLKSIPVASAAALIVVVAIVFSGNSRSYAWMKVLEAWERQGIVQIQAGDETRWLSLAEGLVGEQSSSSSRMFDARRRVLLERVTGEDRIRRREFHSLAGTHIQNGLVLAFLLGQDHVDGDLDDLADVRLVEEKWEPSNGGGVMRLVFETKPSRRLELELALDAKSQLPKSFHVVDGQTEDRRQPLKFSYPPITVAALTADQFPGDVTVVDAEDVAASPQPGEDDPQPESTTPPTGDTVAKNKVDIPNRPGNADVEPPMFGQPSKWRPAKAVDLSAAEVIRLVDATLADVWRANNIEPTVAADDEELLRRVYLDLAGRIPSVSEVRSYLNDKRNNRYEHLVDRLLDSPDHSSHLATVWRTFLIPEGIDLDDFGGVEAFDQWLAERFQSNDSYDKVVRSLLLAEGRLSRSGPLLFYSAAKLDAHQLASRTARVFLGMRLECAQCHDHPFEPWTQNDFWSFAAFFGRISRPQAELESVSRVMRVRDVNRGEVMLPDTDTVVPPRFLNQTERTDDAAGARRQQLAAWLTSAENPYFARATANRVWGHLLGKGIVDPIDDFGTQHTPKSPELLDLLAGQFISSQFDLRELVRTVVLSRAYRLSSGAANPDERRAEWFAQMNVKTLTAEQVYDCIAVATLPASAASNDPNLTRFGNSSRDAFVAQFRTPSARRTEYLGGIPQALTLMNGSLIDDATGLASSGLLTSLDAPFFTNKQRIEILYFATLSRRPRPSEWELLDGYVTEDITGAERQEALADILWALLNSAEFTLNH